MHSRTGLARAGAALLGASATVLLGALPVSANETEAHLDSGAHTPGYRVNLGDGYANMSTTLFGLDIDSGNSLKAYCVEIDVRIDPDRGLQETPWDGFPNPESPFHENRDKISWVLQHGYPAEDTDTIEDALSPEGVEFHDGLSTREAITATQAAVWHFSDGKDLQRDNPTPKNPAAAADVLALYDFLTGEANVGTGEQPRPTLDITPDAAAGDAGGRIGPFTVSTTGDIAELTADLPEGVTLTGADGAEVTAADIADGTELYVNVPEDAEDGQGSIELKGVAHVDTGRLFVAHGYAKKAAQSLIVAQSEKTNLSTGATMTWKAAPEATTPPEETTTTAPPTTTTAPSSEVVAAPPTTETPVAPQADSGELAQTGVSIMTPIVIGAVLLGAGIGALLLQRRRKNA
ncbi:thioester domain-containing protein [Prauserella muralis]|uniref:TQXA domain protein n=1 Tax=Prauserella muralis TaxID=588067 RepID=A0A2V4BCG0_9PSEU|nr:thioester domain-containing protein [Prauserella muralis]PXY31739.1 TQXA domain protein [Prauserella muralis]TWE13873.1 LPXTG-motif cell wall-anchored protein/TQXA domain-containing protein [Prauserella muralis]